MPQRPHLLSNVSPSPLIVDLEKEALEEITTAEQTVQDHRHLYGENYNAQLASVYLETAQLYVPPFSVIVAGDEYYWQG